MRYVRGKGSREARTRPPRTTDARATNSFWTVSNSAGRGILFPQPPLACVAAFGRAALHLSNQRPRGLVSPSLSFSPPKREEERQRGRAKKRGRGSCCNFVSLTFAFGACSIDIGNCAAAANTPPETRSSYYLNILRDTPGEFSTPFIVSAFPTKGDRSEESLGRIFERRSRRKPYREREGFSFRVYIFLFQA